MASHISYLVVWGPGLRVKVFFSDDKRIFVDRTRFYFLSPSLTLSI